MFEYNPSGDSAVIIKVGNEISEEINRIVRKLLVQIEKQNISGIIDFIPSFNELMILYDCSLTGYRELLNELIPLEKEIDTTELPESLVIEVPVLYGGISGPDLEEVAHFSKLSSEDVINIHCSVRYLVYMLGFTPGFCYLGGMDTRIAIPRKQTPRIKIPAGAVGIADNQTGIYPIESPGGWQLIGCTPLKLYNPDTKPEFLIRQGDYIHFYPIDEVQYEEILAEVNNGNFQVKRNKYPC
jgi:KipI family sensor histidine kinase inhibitor